MGVTNLNDIEIYKQIVDNSRNPLECIREFISNSWDEEATEVDIEIIYLKDKGIGIRCKNNGPGLDVEEIKKYILGAGNSTKTFEDENIGNKGIGTLLYLKCNNIFIESRKGRILSRVTWRNPYAYLQNPVKINENIITEVYEEKNNDNCSYVEVYMEGYANSGDITQFHHKKVKDYIKRFTKVGSIAPLLENVNVKFDVRVKGLIFDEDLVSNDSNYIEKLEHLNKINWIGQVYTQKNWEVAKFGFDMPKETSKEDIIGICVSDKKFMEQLKDLSGTKRYQKINAKIREWLVVNFTNEHSKLKKYSKIEYYDSHSGINKESTLTFVISKIGEKSREAFDDMLTTRKNKKFYTQNLRERYGIFLCRDEFPIHQLDNGKLPRLGDSTTGSTQYLGLFNSNDISLIMDRTAPTMNDALIEKIYSNIYYAMKEADSLVVELVNSINKEVDKLLKSSGKDDSKSPNSSEITNVNTGKNISRNEDLNNNRDKNNKNKPSGKAIKIPTNNIIIGGDNLIDIYEKSKASKEKRDRINRFINRKSIKLDKGIFIYEPTSEAELQSELIKITTIIPDIFEFEILDYNSTKGIDILARDKGKRIYKEDDYYYIELKDRLKPDMNHDMREIEYIICWEFSNELRKCCKIKDKLGDEYKIIKSEQGYNAENNHHKVKIIELKDIIQLYLNRCFE